MNTEITFVRHAHAFPYSEEEPLFPGPGLTPLGIEQAELTARFFKGADLDVFLCSSMRRTMETAQIINKYQDKKIEFCNEINEYSEAVFKESLEKTGEFNSETDKANVANRFLNNLFYKNRGKKLLIVTHGNVIRGFLGALRKAPITKSPELSFHLASLTKLVFRGDKLESTLLLNYTDHLKIKQP